MTTGCRIWLVSLVAGNIHLYLGGKLQEFFFGRTWSPSRLWEKDGCFIGVPRQGEPEHRNLQCKGMIDELQAHAQAP